jgi:hypothetical protein
MRGALGGAVGKQFYHKASLRGGRCGMGSSLELARTQFAQGEQNFNPNGPSSRASYYYTCIMCFFFVERAEILKRIEAVLWSQREEKIKCSCSHTDF